MQGVDFGPIICICAEVVLKTCYCLPLPKDMYNMIIDYIHIQFL